MILNTLKPSKLTATDVLEIFRDMHRHDCSWDPEADPDIDLTFNSTIQEWRWACDLVGWKRLALAWNNYFKVEIPLSAWKAVLTPPKKRKLREVCDLIASHATVESVRVPALLGRECGPAGVLFAVRELLARDGADVENLRPSTLLSTYTKDHWGAIAGPISQLAPGRLPAIEISHPGYGFAGTGFLCTFFFVAMLAAGNGDPLLWIPIFLGTIVFWLIAGHIARHSNPASVTFGDLKTIRDLCMVLAPGIRR